MRKRALVKNFFQITVSVKMTKVILPFKVWLKMASSHHVKARASCPVEGVPSFS